MSVLFCTASGPAQEYAVAVRMLCARASVPGWVIILALAAFLAPAGIARIVLLIALAVACIPAIVTAGVWKRTILGGLNASGYQDRDTTAITGREAAALDQDTAATTAREPAVIDAEFVVEDAMPTGQIRG